MPHLERRLRHQRESYDWSIDSLQKQHIRHVTPPPFLADVTEEAVEYSMFYNEKQSKNDGPCISDISTSSTTFQTTTTKPCNTHGYTFNSSPSNTEITSCPEASTEQISFQAEVDVENKNNDESYEDGEENNETDIDQKSQRLERSLKDMALQVFGFTVADEDVTHSRNKPMEEMKKGEKTHPSETGMVLNSTDYELLKDLAKEISITAGEPKLRNDDDMIGNGSEDSTVQEHWMDKEWRDQRSIKTRLFGALGMTKGNKYEPCDVRKAGSVRNADTGFKSEEPYHKRNTSEELYDTVKESPSTRSKNNIFNIPQSSPSYSSTEPLKKTGPEATVTSVTEKKTFLRRNTQFQKAAAKKREIEKVHLLELGRQWEIQRGVKSREAKSKPVAVKSRIKKKLHNSENKNKIVPGAPKTYDFVIETKKNEGRMRQLRSNPLEIRVERKRRQKLGSPSVPQEAQKAVDEAAIVNLLKKNDCEMSDELEEIKELIDLPTESSPKERVLLDAKIEVGVGLGTLFREMLNPGEKRIRIAEEDEYPRKMKWEVIEDEKSKKRRSGKVHAAPSQFNGNKSGIRTEPEIELLSSNSNICLMSANPRVNENITVHNTIFDGNEIPSNRQDPAAVPNLNTIPKNPSTSQESNNYEKDLKNSATDVYGLKDIYVL